MIINSINPVLITLFGLEIRYYGLAYVIGFLMMYSAFKHISKKGLVEGLNSEGVDDLVLYVMIGVMLGGRLFFVLFYDFADMIGNPVDVFAVWKGGMSFHGGLVGAIFGMWLFRKKKGVSLVPVVNVTAIVAMFALALGRIANYLNSELVGVKSDMPWCVVFTSYDSACRHPYQIYAFISHMLLFSWLVFVVYRNREDLKEYLMKKWILIHFLIGYAVLRIIVDHWKVDYINFGLKTGQWLSIVMIVVGVWLWWRESKLQYESTK